MMMLTVRMTSCKCDSLSAWAFAATCLVHLSPSPSLSHSQPSFMLFCVLPIADATASSSQYCAPQPMKTLAHVALFTETGHRCPVLRWSMLVRETAYKTNRNNRVSTGVSVSSWFFIIWPNCQQSNLACLSLLLVNALLTYTVLLCHCRSFRRAMAHTMNAVCYI
jgi:hypothetical protein